MLQHLRPFIIGLATFAATGIVILDHPALAGSLIG
jgi:hypothetical protein